MHGIVVQSTCWFEGTEHNSDKHGEVVIDTIVPFDCFFDIKDQLHFSSSSGLHALTPQVQPEAIVDLGFLELSMLLPLAPPR